MSGDLLDLKDAQKKNMDFWHSWFLDYIIGIMRAVEDKKLLSLRALGEILMLAGFFAFYYICVDSL